MPDMQERIYCSEQIHIPPTFPYIMKLYCKAAIRTQPYDLLKWSAAYFRALANGEEPPVKERVEYPPYDSPSGLTPGYIKVLINQFGKDPSTTVTAKTLFRKWSDICLDEYLLIKLIALLGANTTVNWVNFVGVCAGFISKTLTQTMILICELFTEEPEGGMATIPYGLFIDLYIFLAEMECGPLTEEEKMQLDAIMVEEDICDVVDKVKQGSYESEVEGEVMYGEDYEPPEEPLVAEGEEGERSEEAEEEETERKDEEEVSYHSREEYSEKESAQPKEEGQQKDDEEEPTDDVDDELGRMSDTSSLRDQDSYRSAPSARAEDSNVSVTDAEIVQAPGPTSDTSVREETSLKMEPSAAVEAAASVEEPKPPPKRINLEDLEESIRIQIEEKLAEESVTMLGEEDREFEELGSYLLKAAGRVQKYTAETLGFKIFKKYMRQEVPGIGPRLESEQVEKVVDFMDYWSHKQEQMVMPRNIRHWMCPPLDRLPNPEP